MNFDFNLPTCKGALEETEDLLEAIEEAQLDHSTELDNSYGTFNNHDISF